MAGNLSTAPKKLEKVLVVSRHDTSQIKDVLTAEGFTVVEGNPDFILCYGGDGTVLFSEIRYPAVPKLIIKTSRACRRYDYSLDELKTVLTKIREHKYCLHKKMKLETEAKGEKLVGLNEIQIHPKLPTQAVRFTLSVDEKDYENVIGDGVIVATPFGSTGYYKATGGKRFSKGIGISFNNPHNSNVDDFVVPEDSAVKLTISRGPAWLLADNNNKFVELGAKDSVTIKKSGSTANFIYVSST
jgi:NAD+ kinase